MLLFKFHGASYIDFVLHCYSFILSTFHFFVVGTGD
jgi:hypothetical protein